jgi:phosphatidylserine/phosphatidylglycerophosphate/cardiolipin synthase-like enzyme
MTSKTQFKQMTINKLLILLFIVGAGLRPLSLSSQTPISQARLLSVGSVVTVRGIATNGSELGKIRYLQDGTAGIAAFPSNGSQAGFDTTVKAGDSIEVTGTLVLFHGLLEISPITSWQIISSGNPLPAPKPIALADLNDDLEGQLVSVECVNFDNAGGIFANAGTYNIVDADGTSAKIYIRTSHPLQNTPIPNGTVHLTAILSEYDDFQLLPRSTDDLAAAPCFYFSEKIEQSNIQTTGFKIAWQTNLLSSAKIRYGTSPALGNEVVQPVQSLSHSYDFSNLQAGSIYWVQIEATHNGNVILSEITPFATKSLSSGEIRLYFNHPIDESTANGLIPNGQSFDELLDATIARIDSAQQTLDVAMYNNNRIDITNALKLAHARGVRVRYVAALDGSSPALQPAPPFPVIYGNSSALMHNKFMVVDADLTDRCWVMSGSLNWTTGNMTQDFNNTLFIQDQSLARTYELEFEEMWGSDGASPDESNARFGAAKKNNTPHQFIIGSIPVESYFSPSDQTTNRIAEAIETADSEALFALLTFTKDEQANALADVFANGAQVRGMIDNVNDQGSEYTYLLSQGVNVQPHTAGGILHHKYGIIDANAPNSAPVVVTGSHNWTFSAETANDENTLVIHDADIALLYKAEFERRWAENSTSTHLPAFQQVKIFPNPVSDVLTLQFESPVSGFISVKNILGETVLQTAATSRLNVGSFPPGFYFAVIETRHGIASVSFQKI